MLRGVGFTVAIALGGIAVWLIVTSDTQKSLRIAILVGLWGLLLGAYSMFGARRSLVDELAEASAEGPSRREVALRDSRTAVERADDANARREWEHRLERLIAHEISNGVARETAALRGEIAALRKELLEKVGGQLRLERIETTRVIGSDLEALQHEVRQLKSVTEDVRLPDLVGGDQRLSLRPVVEPARVRPVSRATAEVEADVRPANSEVPEHDTPPLTAPGVPGAAGVPARVADRSVHGDDPAARVHQPPVRDERAAQPVQPAQPAQRPPQGREQAGRPGGPQQGGQQAGQPAGLRPTLRPAQAADRPAQGGQGQPQQRRPEQPRLQQPGGADPRQALPHDAQQAAEREAREAAVRARGRGSDRHTDRRAGRSADESAGRTPGPAAHGRGDRAARPAAAAAGGPAA